MLHEVGANFAVVKTLPQATESELEIGEKRSITLLDDKTVDKGEGVHERAAIRFVARVVAGFSGHVKRGCDAFQINGGGVAGCVGLVVVDESAGLLLLIAEQPVGDFKDELGEVGLSADVPPVAECLQQPCDLAKVTVVAEAMAVIAEGALESCLIDGGCALFDGYRGVLAFTLP